MKRLITVVAAMGLTVTPVVAQPPDPQISGLKQQQELARKTGNFCTNQSSVSQALVEASRNPKAMAPQEPPLTEGNLSNPQIAAYDGRSVYCSYTVLHNNGVRTKLLFVGVEDGTGKFVFAMPNRQ